MLIYQEIDEFIQSGKTLDTQLEIHTDYDDQQIHKILSNCNLEGSSWESLDYHTRIYKTYDKDGNSEWMTVLFIDTTDKKIDDLVSLSAIIQEAEDKFYEFDNDELFDD
ncbi:hypothetical protein [Candidatus Sulfurimonas baltica]|uniref:Uncharacterized protein n=1 Tax=Candidatus Sulfurimonas baltica TaxID=2740404 RepID=A0A7S7RM12_9BACT|nr:hypothetical protein [Candidatus Sulfurimonas baltica]QOY50953.1 hypothetical protein HUE88_07290 [Candidatus Sulfurimonas baltica]